eukprot:4843775-Prymnesium_polylepis.2
MRCAVCTRAMPQPAPSPPLTRCPTPLQERPLHDAGARRWSARTVMGGLRRDAWHRQPLLGSFQAHADGWLLLLMSRRGFVPDWSARQGHTPPQHRRQAQYDVSRWRNVPSYVDVRRVSPRSERERRWSRARETRRVYRAREGL